MRLLIALALVALPIAGGVALADSPTAEDADSVRRVIESHNQATIAAECKRLEDALRTNGAENGSEKIAWAKLLQRCKSALAPPAGPSSSGAIVPPSTAPVVPQAQQIPPVIKPTVIKPLANLPKAPPKPDTRIPGCFATLADRIAAANEMGYLKNRWWGYANALRGLANQHLGKDNPDFPRLLVLIKDADAETHLALELQYKLLSTPLCNGVSMTTGGPEVGAPRGGELVKDLGSPDFLFGFGIGGGRAHGSRDDDRLPDGRSNK